ncbi:sugar ABC transporter permease [Marispirochaeta sp.]|uniref:carbohydrate ABC transporter permease n=1 Tax=Marispirochaeta sp. TaxID=2038653 RepID=UPI0029C8AC90|nr:sugar ABC transporter permease [Marispirochaeta sp.]
MDLSKGWEKLTTSRRLAFAVFLVPGTIFFLLLVIYPVLSSFTYSLYSWNGLEREAFIGFQNFKTVFASDNPICARFWNAAGHNGYSLIFVVVFQSTVGFAFALMLFQDLPGTKFFRALVFLPVTLSIVVVGFLFNLMLHPTWGMVNAVVRLAGDPEFAFPWLGDPRTALTTILLINIWQWAGFPTLIFLSGLNNIPQPIIEATKLDGVSSFRRIKDIYLPLIVPQILTVLILTITGNLRMFDIVYSLTGPTGGPNYTTDVLGTLFYRTAFGGITGLANKGLGATIGIIIVIVTAVISLMVNKLLNKKRIQLEG